ncbi:hypothetical protein B7C51_04595 [Paenibacillus larvae subsp. pulvifaciens]|uniref:Uncharacterized protein n=1 Tax=Paenibacillus larvae subsp. pulvifaciens TaxID=1477 RepID=A0A1V0UPP3_9BACL|nr:hypothetical protein [Paenibacillus larvae]ARF67253.1 hypothetical protein B7C51_04595 [Paenibacillus larvae subsp. pulvifaciens]
MNENSVIHLKKSTAFEATGETVAIEITVENSSPERLKLLGGTVDVLCTELRQYFNDGKSVPPKGGSNIPRPGEHLREILLHLREVTDALQFHISRIGQIDNVTSKWLLAGDLGQLRLAIRKLEAKVN